MKAIKKYTFIYLFPLVLPILFSACNYDNRLNAHSHSFDKWITVEEATCTTAGKQKALCSCGKIVYQTIAMTQHTALYETVTSPTCTEPGYTTHTCICGKTYTDSFTEILPHSEYADCPHTLKGKNISFLGDSITTFLGWSNNATFNSTLASNAVFYERPDKKGLLSSVYDTWWMKTVNELELNLCVNNSCSGSSVSLKNSVVSAGCMSRPHNLHNDNSGVLPDIIIVYLGTNDFHKDVEPGTFTNLSDIFNDQTGEYIGNLNHFAPAYATMVHKIKTSYPDSDIYLCTIDYYNFTNAKDPLPFNNTIKLIAEYFSCNIIDFYEGTSVSPAEISKYTVDSFLHPNALGMTQMYECTRAVLSQNYNIYR